VWRAGCVEGWVCGEDKYTFTNIRISTWMCKCRPQAPVMAESVQIREVRKCFVDN
jgi:hypothetical protein